MTPKPSTPWIYRWSRHAIGAVATIGLVETAFLTAVEFAGSAADVCPTSGCKEVLESPYATVFGLPLTLFGFIAYTSMAILALAPLAIAPEKNQQLRSKLENNTWLPMFALGTAMLVFSINLMYLMLFKIDALCPYCIASALLSVTLFVLTIIGRDWENVGQFFLTCTLVVMASTIAALGVYANVDDSVASPLRIATGETTQRSPKSETKGGETGPPIINISGASEIALAQHLNDIGTKEYGAYWCPHCHEQKELFGKEAFSLINYVECDAKGNNARPQMCKAAGISGFPTWEIKGKLYVGVQPLEKLAEISGYSGPSDFHYPFLYR